MYFTLETDWTALGEYPLTWSNLHCPLKTTVCRDITGWSTGRGKLDVSQLTGIQMVCCSTWDPHLLAVSAVIRVICGKCYLPHTASQHSYHMSPSFPIESVSLFSTPSNPHRTRQGAAQTLQVWKKVRLWRSHSLWSSWLALAFSHKTNHLHYHYFKKNSKHNTCCSWDVYGCNGFSVRSLWCGKKAEGAFQA